MKRFKKVIFIILLLALAIIGAHLFYLSTLAAEETYPDDSFLLASPEKTALIIVAHDDDAVGSSGTISMLCDKGWEIRELCFFQQGGLYLEKDSLKNPIRKRSLQQAAKIQGLQGVDPIDFNFRRNMDSEKSYMPMPYSSFPEAYRMDSLKGYIGAYIEKYKPSVIFTLDDSVGGYGHPDHVLISQIVKAYCKEQKDTPGFSVKKIYQPVFPPSLANKILKNSPVYQEAKKTYQAAGMPGPDVQVNFYEYASQKKAAMLAYTTEQNSIKKIWPYYNLYPSWIYFRIFNRDFFRVLEVKDL